MCLIEDLSKYAPRHWTPPPKIISPKCKSNPSFTQIDSLIIGFIVPLWRVSRPPASVAPCTDTNRQTGRHQLTETDGKRHDLPKHK